MASRRSGKKSVFRRWVGRTGLVLVSLTLVFCIGIGVYIYILLGKAGYVDIPVASDYSVSEGILDDESDPNDPDAPADDSAISEVSSVNDSSGGTASYSTVPYVPVEWGKGRVSIYYDSRFPIRRVEQKQPHVVNYLIFGVDARSASEQRSRTDSMIIVSVDTLHNSIKLTSVMRDTQVKIEGRTLLNKMNAAYVFGGIGLMINTINRTFDLDIQKFAMVDMWSSEGIIDAVGGINIDVKTDEVGHINGHVSFANSTFRDFTESSPYISGPGLQLLNGRQAVGYGRIRYIGSDTARTQRQRTVLTELIKSFKAAPFSSKLRVFDRMAQSFESNITKSEMMALAFDVLAGMKNIQQYRVPENGMYTSNSNNYQLRIDFDRQIPALHDFIWGNEHKQETSLPEEGDEPTATPSSEPTAEPTLSPESALSGESSPEITVTPDPLVTVTIGPSGSDIPSGSIVPSGSEGTSGGTSGISGTSSTSGSGATPTPAPDSSSASSSSP